MQLPKSFKPDSYSESVHPQQKIFEENQFNNPADHYDAEKEARQLIVKALSEKYKQPCISKYDLSNPGYMRRNKITLEAIQNGDFKVV